MTKAIDGEQNTTDFVLDAWGRITEIHTPEGGTEHYTYDYAGNITSTTDVNGGTITYRYNSMEQVHEVIDQEGNGEFLYNYSDETLADATESIFLLNTENAILMWNYICIPLSYKYDISYMLDDIMILLNELKNKKNGVITINWLPDTFRCNWTIRWNDETLDIQAQWENTVGNLENLLNRCPNITLPKNDFIQEWKSVLGTVIKNLKDCGYNTNNIKGMKQLIEIHKDIKGKGVLYKE